jgi:hypothetical protein
MLDPTLIRTLPAAPAELSPLPKLTLPLNPADEPVNSDTSPLPCEPSSFVSTRTAEPLTDVAPSTALISTDPPVPEVKTTDPPSPEPEELIPADRITSPDLPSLESPDAIITDPDANAESEDLTDIAPDEPNWLEPLLTATFPPASAPVSELPPFSVLDPPTETILSPASNCSEPPFPADDPPVILVKAPGVATELFPAVILTEPPTPLAPSPPAILNDPPLAPAPPATETIPPDPPERRASPDRMTTSEPPKSELEPAISDTDPASAALPLAILILPEAVVDSLVTNSIAPLPLSMDPPVASRIPPLSLVAAPVTIDSTPLEAPAPEDTIRRPPCPCDASPDATEMSPAFSSAEPVDTDTSPDRVPADVATSTVPVILSMVAPDRICTAPPIWDADAPPAIVTRPPSSQP